MAASANPSDLSFAKLGSPTSEHVNRFRQDLGRLRRWGSQSVLTRDDLDDASLLVYRWLFDKHPVLVDLCTLLGVQLWLPGMSAREQAYVDAVDALGPAFRVQGVIGMNSPFGLAWRPLTAWRRESGFHVDGHGVAREALVRFVRNKLGAGHFDQVERTKWQRDLTALSSSLIVMGQDALSYQMRAIVGSG